MEMRIRQLVSALTLAGAAFCGHGAEASTIYTYDFSQSGYIIDWNPSEILPATLKGTFSGTADSIDHISLSTLTDFHVRFDIGPHSAGYTGLPDFFSFQIGDTSGGTLAFQSPVPILAIPGDSSEACVGVAVAALCDGGTARGFVGARFNTTLLNTSTSGIAPIVTLVSAVSQTPVATTPIPGALLLFATALGGLGAAGAWRRKAARA
jgi:hypothetical protein